MTNGQAVVRKIQIIENQVEISTIFNVILIQNSRDRAKFHYIFL